MNLAAMEALAKAPEFFYVDPWLRDGERWLCAIGEAAILAVRLDGREPPTNRVVLRAPSWYHGDKTHWLRDRIDDARVIWPERAHLAELRPWLAQQGTEPQKDEARGWFGDVLIDRALVQRYLAPVEQPDQRVFIHLRTPSEAVRISGESWCLLVMPCLLKDGEDRNGLRWEERAA